MAQRHTETEVVRTYEIIPQLSVRLVEIPRRSQFPRCAFCGTGNYWHVTWPTAMALVVDHRDFDRLKEGMIKPHAPILGQAAALA